MTDLVSLRQRLADEATRKQAAIEIGDWARALCLLMGTTFKTACMVGALFAIGIAREWGEP